MEQNQTEENIKEYTNLLDTFTNLGGFYFEKEYEAAIKKFGFDDEQKHRKLSEFSGGQRTKIAFLKLLFMFSSKSRNTRWSNCSLVRAGFKSITNFNSFSLSIFPI